MSENAKTSVCELCREQPATTLCAECSRCYCDRCNKFMHGIESLRKHKTEAIPEGVAVQAMCPIHKNNALENFCVDEIKLSCDGCITVLKNFHENHKVLKIADILKDNETFSAAAIKKAFAEALRGIDELDKRLKEAVETMRSEAEATQKKVKATFEEAHRRLDEEEGGLMRELEKVFGECEDALQKNMQYLQETSEYGKTLNEANAKCGEKCSRLMELNLVSEMEGQRRALEELRRMVMTGLRVTWDSESRKLAYTKTLISGAPVPSNVRTASNVLWEVNIAWECNISKIPKEMKGKEVKTRKVRGGNQKENENEESGWRRCTQGRTQSALQRTSSWWTWIQSTVCT